MPAPAMAALESTDASIVAVAELTLRMKFSTSATDISPRFNLPNNATSGFALARYRWYVLGCD